MRLPHPLLVPLALLAACGSSRAPLPLPASALSPVPPLPSPPPREARVPELTLPPIHAFTLDNGVSVQIAERHGAPVVYAALVGRAPHTAGSGAPVALDALLEHALGAELPSGIDDLDDGGYLSTRVNERGVMLVSRSVSDSLPGVLRRFARVAEGRVFEDGEVDRAKHALMVHARYRQRLRRRRRYPESGEELLTRLYGEDDPRVVRARVRPTTLARLQTSDVLRRLAQLLPPSKTALIIVGDVDPARTEALVRERLGPATLRVAPTPATRSAPPVFPEPTPRLMIFPTGDEPIASTRLIERGPPRHHDDHAAFRLYVRLAGGMFSSRLNLRLREQRGDTYGVMSRVIDRADHSLFEISVVVPVQAVGDAAASIVGELSRLCDASQITSEEMSLARTVELARLSASLDTAAGLGSALVGAHLAGEPPESILQTYRRVEHVTPADVAEVGRRWVRPEHAPMVVVGDWRWLISHPVRVPGGVAFITH